MQATKASENSFKYHAKNDFLGHSTGILPLLFSQITLSKALCTLHYIKQRKFWKTAEDSKAYALIILGFDEFGSQSHKERKLNSKQEAQLFPSNPATDGVKEPVLV